MDPKIMERRAKEWMSIFREQAESGIGKDEWCSQNGVNRSNFYRWQRKCRELALLSQDENLPAPSLSSPDDHQDFVEIPFSGNCVPSSSGESNICLSVSGINILLNGTVDENNLAKVLRVISNVY